MANTISKMNNKIKHSTAWIVKNRYGGGVFLTIASESPTSDGGDGWFTRSGYWQNGSRLKGKFAKQLTFENSPYKLTRLLVENKEFYV